jgi:hypothetical protein
MEGIIAQHRRVIDDFKSAVGEGSRMSDLEALRFLNARKMIISQSTELYHNHQEYIKKEGYLPARVHTGFFDRSLFQVTDKHDKEGRRILLFRPRYGQPELWNLDRTAVFMALDSLSRDPEVLLKGVTVLVDGHGVTLDKASRHVSKDMSTMLQNVVPLRLGHIVICRTPTIFNLIYPIITFFMNDVLKQKIILANRDVSAINSIIDLHQLPAKLHLALTQPELHGDITHDDSGIASDAANRSRAYIDQQFSIHSTSYVKM